MAYEVKKKYPRSTQDLHLERKMVNQAANEGLMASGNFQKECEIVGIPATRRQASKYRAKKGAAYRLRHVI